jgi:putative transposase
VLTNRPPPLKAFDYTGFHRYSLTFCTDRRRPLFRDEAVVKLVLLQISRAAAERGFSVIAYCFMPDHLHLLIHGEHEAANCKSFISLAKQYSGYYYQKEFSEVLWQRYGYERTLRKEEQTVVVARYILENPVRATLVECVLDYPFGGSLICDVKELLDSVGSG